MFLPRITFANADAYAAAARADLIRAGQYVEFDGIRARYAGRTEAHVVTLYWRSGHGKSARQLLRDRARRKRGA